MELSSPKLESSISGNIRNFFGVGFSFAFLARKVSSLLKISISRNIGTSFWGENIRNFLILGLRSSIS